MPDQYFNLIPNVRFEGPESDNPFAYRYYNPNQVVAGKTMREHFKFAMAYWHTLGGRGEDPFGLPTTTFPWHTIKDPLDAARAKADAAFEFLTKMDFDYFCFHDTDLVDEGERLSTFEKRLATTVDYINLKQRETGKKVLWGTANCFSHPRYMNGAATNPDFKVVAHAGAQIKLALDTTIALQGENYVFWGGREGYMSLLNTDLSRELDHLAMLLGKARDYARSQGFKGTFFIEPKPMEPMKHQYDFDAATCIGFLKEYQLDQDFKLNIEVNHATLAQHSFQHELEIAARAGMLGSIDANRGDYQNGWDTDQFPTNIQETTEAMLVLLNAGGLQGGGINFDAKLRRNSTDLEDLFFAHINGVDTFARALVLADKLMNTPAYRQLRQARYASFDTGQGKAFEAGELSLDQLVEIAKNQGPILPRSGKQERLEQLINRLI